MLKFTHREPIGSSTFPMPGDKVDYGRTLAALAGDVPSGRQTSTLYIHIPFCDQICSFCAFNKAVSSEPVKNQYVKALVKEMEMYGRTNYVQGLDIKAVYIGGGTPNSLSNEDLKIMLAALQANFPLSKDCEISLEGTPQNFTPARNNVLLEGGVNRVSAGIQTFDRTIRQEHLHMNDGEVELAGYIENIKASFPNFNLDMIYNLPNQTDETWKQDLRLAMGSGSKHLTVYPLVLLESTIFYNDYVRKQKYEAPAEDREIDLFRYTHEKLMSGAYNNDYSIRDYAKPGYECRYIRLNAESNQIIALGAGAHGYLAGQTYHNEKSTKDYIRTVLQGDILPIAGQRFTTEYEEMQRFMVMGLRLETFDSRRFKERFGIPVEQVFGDQLNAAVGGGYLQKSGGISPLMGEFVACVKQAPIGSYTHTMDGLIWANNIRTLFEGGAAKSVGYSDTLSVGETGKDHYSALSRVKSSVNLESGSAPSPVIIPIELKRG